MREFYLYEVPLTHMAKFTRVKRQTSSGTRFKSRTRKKWMASPDQDRLLLHKSILFCWSKTAGSLFISSLRRLSRNSAPKRALLSKSRFPLQISHLRYLSSNKLKDDKIFKWLSPQILLFTARFQELYMYTHADALTRIHLRITARPFLFHL